MLHQAHINLLRRASDRAPVVGTRGKFTKQVGRNHGIANARAMGCPSLFLSTEPHVSRILANKIRDPPHNPRLAITLPHALKPKLLHFILRLLMENPESIAILQDKRDVVALERAEKELGVVVPKHRITYFKSVEAWRDAICKLDAIVGPRIHGAMIGFLCPIPMLVIPLDLRVDELVHSMKVPHLRLYAPVFFGDVSQLSVKDMFDAAKFDPVAFDENRYLQASRYEKYFQAMGLSPTPLIRMLANMRAQ